MAPRHNLPMTDAATTRLPDIAPAGDGAAILAQITAGLAHGGDLPALLHGFLRPVVQIAGARGGAVRMLDEAGRQLLLVGSLGMPPAVLDAERRVAHDCGACGAAALRDQPVWTEDLSACARRSDGEFFGHATQRVLAVPLHHRTQVLGVYSLFFDSAGKPAPQVLALLKSIGDLLGLALHTARLEREHLRNALLAERHAMAAEVHDSIAQTLVFAKLRLPLLESAIESHDREASLRYCADLRHAMSEAHGGLRHLLTQFRAPVDPAGFRHAIETSRAVLRRAASVDLAFDDRAPDLQLSEAQEAQVHRIVQEALSNIARHADARHAWVTVARRGRDLEIIVDDDGRGLPESAPGVAQSHFGLGIMRERAALLGGALDVVPRDGGGTRVRLNFPVAEPARRP